jgi:hypothetical protein
MHVDCKVAGGWFGDRGLELRSSTKDNWGLGWDFQGWEKTGWETGNQWKKIGGWEEKKGVRHAETCKMTRFRPDHRGCAER